MVVDAITIANELLGIFLSNYKLKKKHTLNHILKLKIFEVIK
jgi:hypothetical protein